MSLPVFPWTVNKFFSTQINASNTISGTYKNVSLQVAGSSEFNNTTITSCGINKNNDGSTYKLDVMGNVNIEGGIFVNGVPFTGGSTNAETINLTPDNTAGTYYIPFSKTTTASNNILYVDNGASPLTFNPSTSAVGCGVLTAGTLNTGSFTASSTTTLSGNVNVAKLPTYTGANPVAPLSTNLIPRSFADETYAQIAATNTFTNTNTFTGTVLPYFPLTNTSYRLGLNAMQYQTASATDNVVWGTNALQGDATNPTFNKTKRGVFIGKDAGKSLYYEDGTDATNTDDNVCIGYQAGASMFSNSSKNVIIGSKTGSISNLIKNCVFIGADVCSSPLSQYNLQNNVIIGAGTGTSFSDNTNITIVGALSLPIFTGNSPTCFGFANGLNSINNNSGVWCGSESGQNLNSNFGTLCFGTRCANGLVEGGYCGFFGLDCDTTNQTMMNTYVFGKSSYCDRSNTFFIGGNHDSLYMDLQISKKNLVLCNREIGATGETINISDPEHIIITNNTVVDIGLFVPETATIGARFTFVKAYSPYVSITITASAGLTIRTSSGNANTCVFSAEQGYLTLICIATTGTAWITSGEASSNASTVSLTQDNTNANYYLPFSKTRTATGNELYVDTSTTAPTYNPFQGRLTTTQFYGTDIVQSAKKSYGALASVETSAVSYSWNFGDAETLSLYGTLAQNVVLPAPTAGSAGTLMRIVKTTNAACNVSVQGGGLILNADNVPATPNIVGIQQNIAIYQVITNNSNQLQWSEFDGVNPTTTMILASAQTITGTKTYDNTNIFLQPREINLANDVKYRPFGVNDTTITTSVNLQTSTSILAKYNRVATNAAITITLPLTSDPRVFSGQELIFRRTGGISGGVVSFVPTSPDKIQGLTSSTEAVVATVGMPATTGMSVKLACIAKRYEAGYPSYGVWAMLPS